MTAIPPGQPDSGNASFIKKYCQRHNCEPADFPEKVLWQCINPQRILLGRLIWFFSPDVFQSDFNMINEVKDATSYDQVRRNIDFFRKQPSTKNYLRHTLNVRISRDRLLKLAALELGSNEGEASVKPLIANDQPGTAGKHSGIEPMISQGNAAGKSTDREASQESSKTQPPAHTVRWILAILAIFLTLPPFFANSPDIGPDNSSSLSLQLANMHGQVFGREFVSTDGPLGWLLVHYPISKAGLICFDFYLMGSLLYLYLLVLPGRPGWRDGFLLIALALITKLGILMSLPSLIFVLLCFWLWLVFDRGGPLTVAACLTGAVLVFFTKVSFVLILLGLIPAYGLGLLVLRTDRRISSGFILLGFPLLVGLGAVLWHTDLPGYLRSAVELIANYPDAMFEPARWSYPGFSFAIISLLAMGGVALLDPVWLPWRRQIMILPLIGLAAWLLFKTSFVRFEPPHTETFTKTFPLLLAVWYVAWGSPRILKKLLAASLAFPLLVLLIQTGPMDRLITLYCLRAPYVSGLISAPWRGTSSDLQHQLSEKYPEMLIPAPVRGQIGQASVDVMPWESSLAVINGLNLQPRPIPQSYLAFTPWLDQLNAAFLASATAPDWVLYAGSQSATLDHRPSAWDESITKMAFLENYTFDSEFTQSLRERPQGPLQPSSVFLMKRTPAVARFVPIQTNQVSVTLQEPLVLPATTNLLYLKLNIQPSWTGKLRGMMLSPGLLTVSFNYQDGHAENFRAVPPILQTGVLVNRRVESPDEIRHWLQREAGQNLEVSNISFKAYPPRDFQMPCAGTLIEYRLETISEVPSPR